jgi:hypothetical protein
MKKLVGVAFLLAATATVVQAQIVTSNLQGVVSDATGAVLRGATVTAVSAKTGATRETNADAVGAYRFKLLPRGLYEVRAGVVGFETAVVQAVNLTVGGTVTVDLTLRLAGAERVLVEAEAARLEPSSSQVQGGVQRAQIENLPINDRNFTQLANLIPGAAPSPSYDSTRNRRADGLLEGGGP